MQILGHLGVHHHTAFEALLHMLGGYWPVTIFLGLILCIALRKLVQN
jgi:hypothetical protein